MAKDLTDALRAMTESAQGQTSRVDKALAAARPSTPIGERSGSSGPIIGLGTGRGITSPLTEEDIALREYYEDGWTTSDGLFVLPAVKKIIFTDAIGSEVVFNFSAPA